MQHEPAVLKPLSTLALAVLIFCGACTNNANPSAQAQAALAAASESTFGRLLSGALILTFFVYAFVNVAMVSGLLPVGEA